MGPLNYRGRRRFLFSLSVFLCVVVRMAAGNVVLIGNNVSQSFDDIEANFAPAIKGSGECGVLYLAEPLDACGQLKNKVVEDAGSSFALIVRGGCTFDEKVRSAQKAGFKAAIVYNNEDNGALIASNIFFSKPQLMLSSVTDQTGASLSTPLLSSTCYSAIGALIRSISCDLQIRSWWSSNVSHLAVWLVVYLENLVSFHICPDFLILGEYWRLPWLPELDFMASMLGPSY